MNDLFEGVNIENIFGEIMWKIKLLYPGYRFSFITFVIESVSCVVPGKSGNTEVFKEKQRKPT